MDDSQFHRIAKALADPTRFRLLEQISAGPQVSCSNLAETAGLTPATISHHIKELTDSGLIESRRQGKFMLLKASRNRLTDYQKELRRRLGLR